MSVESINANPVPVSLSQSNTKPMDIEKNSQPKPEQPVKEVAEVTKAVETNPQELEAAVDKLNNFVSNVAQRDLSFAIDQDSNQMVVVVKDKLTQDVIRQMPTKEALAVAKQIESMLGLILNDKA